MCDICSLSATLFEVHTTAKRPSLLHIHLIKNAAAGFQDIIIPLTWFNWVWVLMYAKSTIHLWLRHDSEAFNGFFRQFGFFSP